MRKVFAQSKILVLVTAACATSLLLGAGCPASDVLDPNKQPSGGTVGGPSFQFTAPTARATVTVGGSIGLSWTDSHPAGDATVRLFYDHDGSANTGDETTITMMNEPAATTSGGYAWNTTGMVMDVYRLGATIDDHTNPPLTRYSPYEVVVRASGSGGGSGGLEPTLTVLQPAIATSPQPGSSILIRWNATNAPPQAKLYLYYDKDKVSSNLNEELIAVVGSGTGQIGSNDYGWTIPTTIPSGTYYILARLTDGLGTELAAYAPGQVVIGGGTSLGALRDMSQIGVNFAGVTFDGYIAGGRMGEVMTGGKDFSGDSYPDFMFVAPKVRSTWNFYSGTWSDDVGEAYLVYARGASGRWPQRQVFSMANLGTYNDTQGVQFVGPTFTSSTSGIQEAIMIDDQDGDGRPEIVFGIPDVDRIVEDQQDYDPENSPTLHSTVAGAQPGHYYFLADGWQEYSDQPDGASDDWLMLPGEIKGDAAPDNGKRSGMIIYVSSRSAISNRVVLMDEIGGRQNWAHPRVADSFGMRLYPIASSDITQWGAQLATVDLFSRPATPALLVARPNDDGGAGSVKIIVQEAMAPEFQAWTAAPALNWNTEPKTWSFPAPDSYDNNGDTDRIARWPQNVWNVFMDPLPWTRGRVPVLPPSPANFAIMTSNKMVGANGHLGHPTNLKDFNQDSLGDVAVSAPDATPSAGLVQAGMAYIVAGNPGLRGADVSMFASFGAAMSLAGTQAGEQLGWKMAGPGDLNGDGYNDWLLTAPNRSWAGRDNCGAVMIVYGRPMPYAAYNVDDVTGQLQGAIIYGQNKDDHLGLYLAAVGDVDRDNYPDFVVAAPGYDYPGDPDANPPVAARQNCGAVYLIYGGPHLVGEFDIQDVGTAQLPGKVYIGPEADAAIGPVAAAGDTDRDYFADFLIAYPGATPNPVLPQAGRAWLIYGGLKQAP